MKTPNSSQNRPARRTLVLMKGLLLLVAAGALVSCGTHSTGTAQARPPAQKSGNWKLVQSNPPTYFPIGIRADHPTDYWDGMWVSSGDAAGTRYFIPATGGNTEALIEEALASLDPAKRKRLDRELRAEGIKRAVGLALVVPPAALLTGDWGSGGGYSGGSFSGLSGLSSGCPSSAGGMGCAAGAGK